MNKESRESFITIKPQDEVIAQHVAYYYFHDSENEDYYENIIYHPHYYVPLNVYKNVKVIWDEHSRTYVPTDSEELSIILTIKNKTSKEVRLRGAFSKVGIIFNPLGINHFIEAPLRDTVSDIRVSSYEHFEESFNALMAKIYDEPDCSIKRDLLDAYFLSRYRPFHDSRLKHAVKLIMESPKMYKTQELADELKISRETLLRLFKKHLCFSVEEFKSVVKFRRALAYYEEAIEKPKLTEVALETEYYDQSDFINHFKAVTGFNPKSFFANIKTIGMNGPYWTFED